MALASIAVKLFPRMDRQPILGDLIEHHRYLTTHAHPTGAVWWLWSQIAMLPLRGLFASARRWHRRSVARRPKTPIRGPSVPAALRQLRRRPAVTLGSAVVLSLGIAATVSMFSIFGVFLWPDTGLTDPDTLWALEKRIGRRTSVRFSPAESEALADAAAGRFTTYATSNVVFGHPSATRTVLAAAVSDNFFAVARTPPMLGRDFRGRRTGEREVILAFEYWRRAIGSDSSIVGTTVTIDREPATVVGVAPRGLNGLNTVNPPLIWLATETEARGAPYVLARGLAPTDFPPPPVLAQAIDALRAPSASSGGPSAVRYVPIRRALGSSGERGTMVQAWTVALALAIFVTLIACGNVANALVADGVRRRPEFAVRSALGASPRRLVVQSMTETALLAVGAGLVGLVFARWFLTVAPGWLPTSTNSMNNAFPIRAPESAAAIVLVGLTALIAGALPARYASRVRFVTQAARGGDRGGRRHTTTDVLIVSQVALSVALLILAGLLATGIRQLRDDRFGYVEEHRYAFSLQLPAERYTEMEGRAFWKTIVDSVRTLPGVVEAGLTSYPTFAAFSETTSVYLAADAEVPASTVSRMNVDEGFFTALDIPIQTTPSAWGSTGETPTIAVSRRVASQLWPDADPRDRLLYFGDERRPMRVGGVVADATYGSVRVLALVYTPVDQHYRSRATVVIHAPNQRTRLAAPIADVVRRLDADLPQPVIVPVSEWFERAWVLHRGLAVLASGLSLLAAGICGFGVYAGFSNLIGQRRRELGIQIALGATGRRLAWSVLRHALVLATVGFGIGALVAYWGGQFISAYFVGVGLDYLPMYLAVLVGTWTIAAGAVGLPVRKATRADPLETLRAG